MIISTLPTACRARCSHNVNNVQLHCWSGLSKYGWEAHDGKTYGRQELHDGALHLTTTWVKRQCNGCGYGGDWALLLDAKQLATLDPPADQDLTDTDAKPKRISVVFYVADERKHPIEVQTDDLKGGSNRVLQGGSTGDDWQLHLGSSSELSNLVLSGYETSR